MSLRAAFAFVWPALAVCACTLLAPPLEAIPERPPRERVERFFLEGRISVRAPAQAFSARTTWRHEAGRDEIMLNSPLGQGIARLTGDASGARLETADRGTFMGATVEALSEDFFGLSLPLADMPRWVIGRSGSAPEWVHRDDRQRLLGLVERGWRIDYAEYESESADALPRRVFLQRGEIEVRLAIDRWELPE